MYKMDSLMKPGISEQIVDNFFRSGLIGMLRGLKGTLINPIGDGVERVKDISGILCNGLVGCP
jgi:hypothetical protein